MTEAAAARDDRIYGWMLIGASLLAVGLAMMHPQLRSHDLAGVLRELVAGARFNGWIHGLLMAVNIVLVAGFAGLSRRLGAGRPEVTLAMTAYAIGAIAMLGAAVINGFALATFAGRSDAAGPDQAAALAAAFNLAGSIGAAWAAVGAAATSGAILAWSLRLAALPGAARAVGAVGILLGLAAIVMLASGLLVLDVHGFLILVAAQTAWTLAVGVLLIRGRL